jgi:hypothetical protein
MSADAEAMISGNFGCPAWINVFSVYFLDIYGRSAEEDLYFLGPQTMKHRSPIPRADLFALINGEVLRETPYPGKDQGGQMVLCLIE